MKVAVTGATGLIGNALVKRLVLEGHRVRALVRDVDRAKRLLPAAVELERGDLEDSGSIARAVSGADWLFHTAGMPQQWQPDDSVFDRINRKGTASVMQVALSSGVKRVVYTSTMDVFAVGPSGTLVEPNLDPSPKPTAYERSKQAAEREVEAVRAKGLDVVYVNPAGVYGPSPVHVGLNSMFLRLMRGQMPMVPPGGLSVAYVDGVADAHLAAAKRGVSGERYLVADAHVSNRKLAEAIVLEAGLRRTPPSAPAWLLRAVAGVSAPLARRFGFEPIIAPGQLSFLLWNAKVDASKAMRELGFVPTKLADGVKKTVAFLRAEKLVQ
jgi:nucleoside-diphosphate-sugar epimerase